MWTTPLAVDGPVAVRGPDSAVVSLASATAVINEHAIAPNHATVGIIAQLLRTIAPPRTDPPSIEGSETEREAEGQLRELKIGGNAGCSSLSRVNRSRHFRSGLTSFGQWCDSVGRGAYSSDARRVWTVPLRQILRWIDRPVDFVKIDAQV